MSHFSAFFALASKLIKSMPENDLNLPLVQPYKIFDQFQTKTARMRAYIGSVALMQSPLYSSTVGSVPDIFVFLADVLPGQKIYRPELIFQDLGLKDIRQRTAWAMLAFALKARQCI